MFKKIGVFFFIFLYLVAMLKPIAPFVEYAINYDYISKVLCINKDTPEMGCNGKCQLMIKLQEKQQNDYKSLRIHMEEYPVGFVKIISLNNTAFIATHQKEIFNHTNNYEYLFTKTLFHPPLV